MSRSGMIFLLGAAPLLAVCLAVLGAATLPTNPLGWLLLLIGSIYTAGTILFAVIRREHFWEAQTGGAVVQQERGDRSFWLITVAMMAVFYLSPLEYLYWETWLPGTTWMKFTGVGLVIAGSILFIWARRTLGASYSGHVSVEKGQVLVRSGPYGFIRHPAYAGYFLIALGLSVGYSSLAGLLSLFGLLLPGLVYRMQVEEKILAGYFGEAYRQYMRAVKRLVPGVW